MRSRARLLTLATTCALVLGVLSVGTSPDARAAVAPGFVDSTAISGLTQPTAAAFGSDGRVFIAEKSGVVKTFDSLADTTATVTVDLRAKVHDYWDRGLLGLTVDPAYPSRPYVYVAYTYDALPGGTSPRWGDTCPNPPGDTEQGCVVTGQVTRLTVDAGGVSTAQQVLLTDWCQQFPSHSVGTLTFGPDGALYVGGGDGASFNYTDYGQTGNPCADPPSPAGTNLSPPTAKGGALRSQSPRRAAGEPVSLDGAILRIDPNTGAGMTGNPFAASADANARRVIAYGMRNEFRFAFRPGTKELWAGDVGWNTWEEINRIPNATDAVAENFGWPCYEGNARQSGYDGANVAVCESLYGSGQNAPYFTYNHNAQVANNDGCPTGGSSISGIAFESGSNYPAEYKGALFFADSSRNCIWVMPRGTDGQPDPARTASFVIEAGAPVQLLSGPGGDIFYVALIRGQLRRLSYPGGTNHAPTAKVSATPTSGAAPLAVTFSSAGTTDQDSGDALSYAWDLDGDGAFDDSTATSPQWTYLSQAHVSAQLRVTDSGGLSATAPAEITVGDPPSEDPVVTIDTPTTALHWHVGQQVSFTGRAADAQDGTLGASAMSWQLTMQHCTSPTSCHSHNMQTFPGVASGAFTAPDHEYPSYLDLTLTARDTDGRTGSKTIRLDPQTVDLTFTSSPSGASLTVGSVTKTAPFTRTVIVGSTNSISAITPQSLGVRHRWYSWSDGGALSHNLAAPTGPTTYLATYQACPLICLPPRTGTMPHPR